MDTGLLWFLYLPHFRVSAALAGSSVATYERLWLGHGLSSIPPFPPFLLCNKPWTFPCTVRPFPFGFRL
uniref:Secreted protein n=1 Tax=Knipowitschia caucasica TaxID=637954 RepID=A0AAV2J4Z7_KNICA